MQHGAAAAVLRNAYLTRGRHDQQQYAIDLSSAAVRTALWLLDAIRDGQPLGAVLGYRSRRLHDRQLDQYIQGFRQRFPLVAYKASGQVDEGSVESIAARNVVDGLALRRAWNRRALGSQPDGIEAELRALDDAVDAASDLLLAESVFQLVRGNTAGVGATLDTMAQGVRPQSLEIARVRVADLVVSPGGTGRR
jgi:hypothetical protein